MTFLMLYFFKLNSNDVRIDLMNKLRSIEMEEIDGVRVRPAAFIPSPRGGDCIGLRESGRKLRFPPTATGKQTMERDAY
jgi:hypothetical protein